MNELNEVDLSILSIVKTNEELIEENKHGWYDKPPPLTCYYNCFKKSDALKPVNYKIIFPEYYYTYRILNRLKDKYKHQRYNLTYKYKIKYYTELLKTVASPHRLTK